ncbi:hypothetical protein [Corynebacterium comes]|uniref:Uncharacterized protein n=1 Tax=Corynebacterium comes TaxID=2675218 RepID=A0A6B8WBJ8_9CORY|nr:hypothetical protein [Corynebacterium comes]QGU04218.1 hypothetical protein CETAM_04735 [Corynebacterium comes]
MPGLRRSSPLDALAEYSDRAVYVDGVTDKVTARQLIDRVITVAELIALPEVHVWADAEALPLLAAAAAGIKDLPEGFQLRQIAEKPLAVAEGGLTWLSRDLLKHPANVG